jgi:hypothetical protein
MSNDAQHRPILQALVTAAALVWSPVSQPARDDVPPPPPIPAEDAPRARPVAPAPASDAAHRDCAGCGAIRSIREVTREKKTGRDLPSYVGSQQYRDTRQESPAVVGPVVGMTFGPSGENRSYVGAMGSPKAQARQVEILYEVTVRFDDGRFGLYELADRGNLHVDDRVRVVNGTLEPIPK